MVFAMLCSCQCSGQEKTGKRGNKSLSTEQKLERQRNFLKIERESINQYVEDRGLKIERTGIGLYYQIVKDSTAGGNAKSEDLVEFEYVISLMNGTPIYKGSRKLTLDMEDAEIGLHESLKLLGVGDEGLFILPSHLAFGVAGDQNKVPPRTSLVYEIRILNIN